MSKENQKLTYRERPLVRCGNELYYGNMTDKFIIFMKIISSKKVGEVSIPTKVVVQMLYTDPDIKGKNKIVKSSEKESISTALEIASVWLDRSK